MPHKTTEKIQTSHQMEANKVQDIALPFVPRKVNLNDLDDKGNLFTAADIKFLKDKKIQATENNIIFGKKEITRAQVSRRPAVVNKELYAIYTGKQFLGKGAFGKAVLAQKQSAKGPTWTVLKVLLAKKNPLALVQSEVTALREASDTFIGACVKQGGVGAAKHYIMMELAPGKPLSKLLEGDSKVNFSVVRRLDIAIQMIAAIEAINQKGYLHRDIKPGNFNYDPSTNTVSALDYGLAAKKSEDGTATFYGTDFAPGTAAFMAREIALPSLSDIENEHHENVSIYNDATDMYALGVSLKILFGHHYSNWGIVGAKPEFLEKNAELDAFINRMDDEEPSARPTLAEAKQFLTVQLKKLIPEHIERIGILDLQEYEKAGIEKRMELRTALQGMSEVALIDTNTNTQADKLDRRRISLLRELEDANLIINPNIKLARQPVNAIQAIQRDYAALQAAGGKRVALTSFVSGAPIVKNPSPPRRAPSSTAKMLMTIGGAKAPTKERAIFNVPRYSIPSVTPVPEQEQKHTVINTEEQPVSHVTRPGRSSRRT